MKIQSLAVIAIVIILPMAIILNNYSTNQIKTLDLQISYDSKLKSATYDGIKAFQLNMSNSTTSDLSDSKMRDINASIKTFYNSLASHFGMSGYGESVLQNYVPAIVYTLYDGYYIYSAYNNNLDSEDVFYDEATYKDGELIYGLKPYIYYSCRYKKGSSFDVVITYTLDNYITIQGTIGSENVNESGYLLTGVNKNASGKYTYRGVEIKQETDKSGLKQYVYIPDDTTGIGSKKITFNNTYVAGSINQYLQRKINGVKYYKEDSTNRVFAMINDEKIYQENINTDNITNNTNAIQYYADAYEFKNKIISGNLSALKDLKTTDAVDSNGNSYTGDNNPYPIERKIFEGLDGSGGTYIEDSNSDFNNHRRDVIKNSIEKNLITAISNYNTISTSDVNFAMPKLQDYEWESLTNNISMITFLQGLSIGGKVYNGYAIVQNNINEDFVAEESIYVMLDNGQYYRVTDSELLNSSTDLNNAIGVFNVDFERRTALASYKDDIAGIDLEKNVYYYPKEEQGSYNSIINLNTNNNTNSIFEYFDGAGSAGATSNRYKLAQIYYTALGRERYGMYRVNNKLDKVQADLTNP